MPLAFSPLSASTPPSASTPLSPRRRILALAAGACALAGAAAAQAPAAPATRAALTTGSVEAQAGGFVQAYAATTAKLHQIARWNDPLCVQVTGLAPVSTAQVKARVEEVGRAVGLGVLGAGCAPNIEVVFSDRPQKVLDDVAARREVLLGYDHRDARTVKTVTRPIQAWYVTATLGGAGPNGGVAFTNLFVDGKTQTSKRVMDDPDNAPPTGCGDSHFTACLTSVFDNVLVVVDIGRVKDRSVGLLSDYVTMLALAQPRSLEGCNVLPSVIDLYAGACAGRAAPDGLTPADAAYLTALYAADLQANADGEQSQIAGHMARILANAPAVTR